MTLSWQSERSNRFTNNTGDRLLRAKYAMQLFQNSDAHRR